MYDYGGGSKSFFTDTHSFGSSDRACPQRIPSVDFYDVIIFPAYQKPIADAARCSYIAYYAAFSELLMVWLVLVAYFRFQLVFLVVPF